MVKSTTVWTLYLAQAARGQRVYVCVGGDVYVSVRALLLGVRRWPGVDAYGEEIWQRFCVNA
jgi:hypothetical protein